MAGPISAGDLLVFGRGRVNRASAEARKARYINRRLRSARFLRAARKPALATAAGGGGERPRNRAFSLSKARSDDRHAPRPPRSGAWNFENNAAAALGREWRKTGARPIRSREPLLRCCDRWVWGAMRRWECLGWGFLGSSWVFLCFVISVFESLFPGGNLFGFVGRL